MKKETEITQDKTTIAAARRGRLLNSKDEPVKNSMPQIFYGLHMVEGVAEYQDEKSGAPYRVLINEATIKQMDPTFQGRPVYVRHVNEVDVAKIGKGQEDGYVVESFFNKTDGRHWTKFIVVSERGLQAIRNGWKLSNAYVQRRLGQGGLWHGVEYLHEILDAEYEHLAIVPNPRYEESVILTPEEFKVYNSEKEAELLRLANSSDKPKGEFMFNIFKRTKVEKVEKMDDLKDATVMLPKSKKEVSFEKLVNDMDAIYMPDVYANGDHKVKVGEDTMTVNDLVKKYCEMQNQEKPSPEAGNDEEATENGDDEDAKKKALDIAKHEEKEISDKKENDEDESAKDKGDQADAKKKNEAEEAKRKKKENFEKLKNAHNDAAKVSPVVETCYERVARGKELFGS